MHCIHTSSKSILGSQLRCHAPPHDQTCNFTRKTFNSSRRWLLHAFTRSAHQGRLRTNKCNAQRLGGVMSVIFEDEAIETLSQTPRQVDQQDGRVYQQHVSSMQTRREYSDRGGVDRRHTETGDPCRAPPPRPGRHGHVCSQSWLPV